jgi:hypothetical protein
MLATSVALLAQGRKPEHRLDIPGQARSSVPSAAPHVPRSGSSLTLSHQVFTAAVKVNLATIR